MTINPIKILRNWHRRREERRDIELRKASMDFSTRFGDPPQVELYRAYTIFLYMKYGVSKDGLSVDEIYTRKEPERGLKYDCPNRPIRL